MGQAILEASRGDGDVRVVGLVESRTHPRLRETVEVNGGRVSVEPSFPRKPGAVVIDFSVPSACMDMANASAVNGNPLVVGTTGLTQEQDREMDHIARKIPVVVSSNMSLGVNILWRLAREAARLLGPSADVEIIEAHHNRKKDAPSGTALAAARAVNEGLGRDADSGLVFGRSGQSGERPRGEIGMHAVRGGDIAGDHTVLFALEGERMELIHRAHSRQAFALGALRAAKFVAKAKPGKYNMSQVLGLGNPG